MCERWERVALGHVLTQVSRPVKVADLTEVPFAGVRWYTEGVYARDVVPAHKVKTQTLNRLEVGDITYNRMWATKASFGRAGATVDGCLVTNDFPIFEVDTDRALGEYIELFFETTAFQREASVRASGTTERRRLKEPDFLAIKFDLPPLVEQRRIVDLIDAVNDAISVADDLISASEELVQTLRSDIPTGAQVSLGKLLDGIESGHSVASLPGEATGPSILKLSAVRPGRFYAAETKSVGRAALSPGNLVTNGDLLMTRSNTPDRVGYVAVARGIETDTYMPDLIWRLRPRTDKVSGAFLENLLSSKKYRRRITSLASGTSNSMKKINKAKTSGLMVAVPSPDEQATYVARAEAVRDAIEAAERVVASYRFLRTGMLSALLSGEREIPKSYDRLLNRVSPTNDEAAA